MKPRIKMYRGKWKCGIAPEDSYVAATPDIAYKAWAAMSKPKIDAQELLYSELNKRKQKAQWVRNLMAKVIG